MLTDNVSRKAILNKEVAHRKLRRMAFQVAENNESETELLVAGISGNGVVLAQNLVAELQQILSIPIRLLTITLNKKNPLDVRVEEAIDFEGNNILVVDDVANSGKTLLYAIKPFLEFVPKKIQTLVLVERSHKLFSIQPDYVGLSLATTLQEHISVETDGQSITGAWLH